MARQAAMDDDSCSKFIGSLTKYLQSLCHSYVDFSNGVELVGHIYLHVDRGKKIDYVLNESVCKNGSNVVKFTSNSYHAQPMDRKEKKDAPKKAPDPSKPGEEGRKRDDNDVIIVGSEAAKRRRSMGSVSQTQQSQALSNPPQGGGSGMPGNLPPSAGMFRHPRGPNPRMAAPTVPGPRPGAYPYQARRRMPPPQQPQSYLPMGASGFNPRVRHPPYQPQGVQPIGGRGTFPVPSDVASIRGQYPPAPGQLGMGAKTGENRFQHPYHPRQSVPLSLQQGRHTQGSGSQGHGPHLLTSMGSHLSTTMGQRLQNPMGAHLPSSMGPQGLMQSSMPPQTHGHRFLPPYPLGSHSQRQAPSMSLPVTTQLTSSSSHPTSAAVPTSTTTKAPPATTAVPATTTAPASSSAPATGTVMIKGRPVPIPASLAATGQSKMQGQDGVLAKPQTSPSSSASVPSFLHHNQSSGASAESGGSSTSTSSSHGVSGSQQRGVEVMKSASSSAACAGADPLASAMSVAGVSGVQSLTGISPKGRPSTPALEQCAAKKNQSPRGGGSHFQFPPASSGSHSSVPGGVSGPSFVPSGQTSTEMSLKTQASSSSTLDPNTTKNTLSPRAGGSSGYFRYPGSESSQPSHSGSAGAPPLSSLSISIPPFSLPGSGSHSHSGSGSNFHSPRAAERSNPYSGLSGMDLSQPVSGGNHHSPRVSDRSQPYHSMANGSHSHLPASGSSLHSPRAGERSHPYMGSSNVSYPSFSGSGQLSPHGAQPYMGSSSMSLSHSVVSGNNLHSPRASSGSLPYMGSSNISHVSSASESHLYSPRANYGSLPYMGSSNVSHASLGESHLHSPRGGGDRNHPYMGSSNVSHPSAADGNLRSPRGGGGDRGYPSYSDIGSVKLSHLPVSAAHLASPRGGNRSHTSGGGCDSGERNQLFPSLAANGLPCSSEGSSQASFPALTPNESFPPASGTHFPFTSLTDSDLPFPPPVSGDNNNPYPPVHNGRLPYSSLSGSSLPYPTFGDSILPFSSVGGNNISCPPLPLSDMSTDEAMNSQLSQDRVRQSENVFDMFSQQAQADPLEARFNAPPQTDALQVRFGPLPDTDTLAAKSQAADLPPPSTFPLNLSHPAPFSLDQGPGDRDGYSELVSELQALNQPTLNQVPTSPTSCLPADCMPDHGGISLPEGGYPESDAQREQVVSAQPRTSSGDEEGDEGPAPPVLPECESRTEEEGQCGDGASPETTATACQTSSQPVTGDVPQTFLMPCEISASSGGVGQAGGDEFQKRSGSVSSHSHETPSPSPGSVAGTETAVTETKPQGQQASDYDSGCDSGSTSTGERLASPQGQAQSTTAHPQLKSLTIPLVPVDSPSSSAKVYIKQERLAGEEREPAPAPPAPENPPLPEWTKEVDPDWVEDMAVLNNSDSTESYSEDDDPDYVPENPRSTKGSVKRGRSKKTERVSRGKKRKVDNEEKGGEKEGHNSGKTTIQSTENGPAELPPHDESSGQPETKKGDRYDPGMFLLLNTPSEPDRTGRMKASHTPAEVISTPEGETEGLWVHTLVPAGHGLWRLPPDDHKCQTKVDPSHILRTLYKVTVKIVAGKVLYKFDDMHTLD